MCRVSIRVDSNNWPNLWRSTTPNKPKLSNYPNRSMPSCRRSLTVSNRSRTPGCLQSPTLATNYRCSNNRLSISKESSNSYKRSSREFARMNRELKGTNSPSAKGWLSANNKSLSFSKRRKNYPLVSSCRSSKVSYRTSATRIVLGKGCTQLETDCSSPAIPKSKPNRDSSVRGWPKYCRVRLP